VGASLKFEGKLIVQAQGGQGAGFAQQVGHRLGIVVPGQDVVHHRAQPRNAAAHGPVFDLEGGDDVVRGNKSFGHHPTLCERRRAVAVSLRIEKSHRAHMGDRAAAFQDLPEPRFRAGVQRGRS
jgi:hypothetical protein